MLHTALQADGPVAIRYPRGTGAGVGAAARARRPRGRAAPGAPRRARTSRCSPSAAWSAWPRRPPTSCSEAGRLGERREHALGQADGPRDGVVGGSERTRSSSRSRRTPGIGGVGRRRARGARGPGAGPRRCCTWRSPTASSRTARWTSCSPRCGLTPDGVRDAVARPARATSHGTRRVASAWRDRRADVALVEAGLFASREQAKAAILAGEVRVGGAPRHQGRAAAPRRRVDRGRRAPRVRVARRHEARGRARRVRHRRRRDARASTSAPRPAASPTACCSAARASVTAIDVGYGQLAWSLRTDPRVTRPRAHEHPQRRPGDRRARRSISP